jgi:hypothetical protein
MPLKRKAAHETQTQTLATPSSSVDMADVEGTPPDSEASSNSPREPKKPRRTIADPEETESDSETDADAAAASSESVARHATSMPPGSTRPAHRMDQLTAHIGALSRPVADDVTHSLDVLVSFVSSVRPHPRTARPQPQRGRDDAARHPQCGHIGQWSRNHREVALRCESRQLDATRASIRSFADCRVPSCVCLFIPLSTGSLDDESYGPFVVEVNQHLLDAHIALLADPSNSAEAWAALATDIVDLKFQLPAVHSRVLAHLCCTTRAMWFCLWVWAGKLSVAPRYRARSDVEQTKESKTIIQDRFELLLPCVANKAHDPIVRLFNVLHIKAEWLLGRPIVLEPQFETDIAHRATRKAGHAMLGVFLNVIDECRDPSGKFKPPPKTGINEAVYKCLKSCFEISKRVQLSDQNQPLPKPRKGGSRKSEVHLPLPEYVCAILKTLPPSGPLVTLATIVEPQAPTSDPLGILAAVGEAAAHRLHGSDADERRGGSRTDVAVAVAVAAPHTVLAGTD